MIGPVPQAVLAVDAGEGAPALLERVQGLLAAVPPFAVSRDEVVGTTTFKRYDPLVPIRLGVVDGTLWAMVGEETAAKILAVQPGGAPPLTTAERYTAALTKIGTEGRTPVCMFHLDVVHTMAAVRRVMTAMTGEETFSPPVEILLEELGVTDLQSITVTEQIAEGGHRHSIYVASPGRKKGLLRLHDFDPVTDEDLAPIPNDATFAKAANVRLSDVYDEAMRIVEAVGAVAPEVSQTVSAGLTQAEEKIGLKIKEDILDLFDDGWVVFDAPSNGGLLVTGFTMVIETKDAEKVHQLIRKGLQAFANLIDPEEAFTVKTYKHGEHAINFVNITAGPSPVAPAWAFYKDRLVVALYPQIVAQVVDRLASPAAASRSILENPDFVRARKLLPEDCSTVVYMDTRKSVSDLYSIALPLVSAGCSFAQGQGIPLDVSVWPRRDVFTRDLFGDGWGVSSDADGVLIVGHGPWPVPVVPVAAFGPALLGAATSFATARRSVVSPSFEVTIEESPEAAAAADPGQEVISKLEAIGVALQIHAMQNKEQFPPGLEALLAGGNLTAEDLQPPAGLPAFVYVSGQHLKMDTNNVLVYCHLEGEQAWVVTVGGLVQRLAEVEFQAALQDTYERLGR